jgi:hypothetical protein
MDKDVVKRVLAPYCPPLSLSQVDNIASKVAEHSKEELNNVAKVAARRQKSNRKSRSRMNVGE